MKKLIFTLLFAVSVITVFGQESYTALKIPDGKAPAIDGVIDNIWDNVEFVQLAKVPDNANITVPNPDPSDFYAEIGMLWNDTGMFFLFRVTDDIILIEDDDPTLDAVPADKWWTDDNINILFSKDLVNTSFEQWEFAWQEGIDQEEKLSSDDWLNAAKIDISMVQSAWYQDGNDWTLETFINWQSFADGNPTITPGMKIYLEARARDDDDGGTWESMFQWSTTNYSVESTGEGMGEVTLSATEVEVPTAITEHFSGLNQEIIYPNPVNDFSRLSFNLNEPGMVTVKILNLDGKEINTVINELRPQGKQIIPLETKNLSKGNYLVKIVNANGSKVVKLVKL